jgi:ATP-dependent helicase HepA
LGGFPARVAHPVALEAATTFSAAQDTERTSMRNDPRVTWLVRFLDENPDDKILLITSKKSDVFALQDALPTLTTVPFAAFHENLTMTTRDKNAAWFAREDGARLLICSEIGSEGRNFQFAKHLVLFDLPEDPGVLEQRIGRLDRIGRKGDVHIHIPYVRGTTQEILFRWYDEGFDAFRRSVPGADVFHELLGDSLHAVLNDPPYPPRGGNARVDELIEKTREESVRVLELLEKGRDRLLEINGARAGNAAARIAEILALDEDYDLEDYLDEVFDHFGLDVTETSETRGRLVVPGERMLLDSFPGVPGDGLALTYDRAEALAREDLAFLSIDHPVARTAVDLVLVDEEGPSAFVAWAQHPAGG